MIIAIVVGLVLVGGAWFWFKGRGATNQTAEKPTKTKITEQVNVIPVAERPVVFIWPVDSQNVEIEVNSLNKPAQLAEYELEYQAGSLLQGAVDAFEVTTLPVSKKILLGSCSAGGACTYHKDIKGGTLLMRFSNQDDKYVVKADWRYFDTKSTQVSSKDAKFQLEAASLAKQPLVIVFNGFGYPKDLSGTAISDPYTLTTANDLNGTGQLTLRANEEGGTKIMGWDGQAWQSFETKVEGKTLTAEVKLMNLYVAAKE